MQQADGLVQRMRCLIAEPRWEHSIPPLGMWVCHGLRAGLVIGVGARFLVRWPRSGDRLPGDLQVIDEPGPRPDRGALSGFGSIFNQLEQPRVVLTVSVGLDSHATISHCQ